MIDPMYHSPVPPTTHLPPSTITPATGLHCLLDGTARFQRHQNHLTASMLYHIMNIPTYLTDQIDCIRTQSIQ
jgi:hypothetical protein